MSCNKKPFWKPGDGFELSYTIKHFLYGLVLTIMAAGITWTIDYLQVAELPPEYAIYTGLIIALLQGLSNLIKHWNDEYLEE